MELERVNLKLCISKEQYDKLVSISNELNMNAYTLLRTVVSECIKEYETSKDGDNTDGKQAG